ncbi:MAG: thiamine pyrophosphate-binding protein, partial [Actinobacteria bacterium]|nr:thiamine pyrophosphate-binding protein [Actinomycetota bacterium]
HRHPVGTAYFGGRALVHVGEYATALLPLLADLVSTWPVGAGARALAASRRALDAPAPGLRPQDVVRAVQDELGDVPVTVDAGAHMLVAMELWQTDRPAHVLISNGLATMGFALPAAIGAALARPGERVVCLVGDGGLGMVLAELETLARLDLDVAVVVFNDATLSLIELKRSPGVVDTRPVAYHRTDFAAVAAAMGLPSGVATDAAGIRALLAQVPRGPLLVDARVDRGAYRQVMAAIRGTTAPRSDDEVPPDPGRAPTTAEGRPR